MKARLAYGTLIVLAALVVAFAPFPAVRAASPSARVFRINASQFSYSPSVLSVNPGDTVTIELVSTDVDKGYIDFARA